MQINLQKAINNLKEILLPKFEGLKKVMVTSIRIDVDNYETDKSICKVIDMYFYNPNNYVKVGYLIRDFSENRLIDGELNYCSDHDSGWRESLYRIKRELVTICEINNLNFYDDSKFITFDTFNKTKVFDGEILNVNDEKGNIDYKKFKLIKHD